MAEMRPLWVTARLSSPLAQDAPQLDALLEWCVSIHVLDKQAKIDAQEPWKITRDRPAPPQAAVPIPLLRVQVGPWRIACCSEPVLGPVRAETVEYITKSLATEEALLLRPEERRVVSTTNSWTKSYRLPLRVRVVECVRWACVGNRRELRHELRRVISLSKKRSDGYGRISAWEVEEAAADYSWFAPHPAGTLLMRRLPVEVDGRPWLPADLLGYRRDFGACTAPYWHSDRYTEIVTPC